jgi:hypothetical protein
MSYNDDLLNYARQKTERELNSAAEVYNDAVANGDHDQAVEAIRHYRYYERELADLGGSQAQQPLPAERNWLAQRPSISQNPARYQQVMRTYEQIIASGCPRGSEEALRALSFKCDPPTGDPVEMPSADDVLDMMMKSDHISDEEEARQLASRGWQELQRRKAAGDYR